MRTAGVAALVAGVALLLSGAQAETPVIEARWGAGPYGGPTAIAVDDRTGDFYVIDRAIAAVRRFDRQGRLVATWRGSAPNALDAPHSLAVDRHDHVWVTDVRTDRILTFTPDGGLVSAWGGDGHPAARPRGPQAIAVDRDDNVYVYERVPSRVQMFDRSGVVRAAWDVRPAPPLSASGLAVDANRQPYLATGTRIFRLAAGGTLLPVLDLSTPPGTPGPALVTSTPGALALDAAGRLYVVDVLNHRVLRFGSDGRLERAWGGRGTARGSLATYSEGGLAVSAAGVVHVVDHFNYRVQRFSIDGDLVDVVTGFAGDRKLHFPNGLAVDARGDVYVADTRHHRIMKFSPDGEPLARWGSFGREDGELRHPEGVAVDADGAIYVADRGNGRVQKFAPDGGYLLQWGRPERPASTADGGFSPHDVAAGPRGDIYVLLGAKVHRSTRAGAPLGSWSFVGSGMRLGIDAQGNVYVTSTAQAVYPRPADIYPDGRRRAQGQFADGKERGQWITWHPSGQQSSNGDYWDGRRQGRGSPGTRTDASPPRASILTAASTAAGPPSPPMARSSAKSTTATATSTAARSCGGRKA